MEKIKFTDKAIGALNRAKFSLKKHSPEILIVAGVIGTVASAVLACRATLKVNDILADSKQKLETIHDFTGNNILSSKYTDEDAKKDTALLYLQTGIKIAKIYAPAVSLGVLSISGILTSNNILRKRNIALAAAYATVDKSFKEYRKRITERFGEEVEHQIKHGIKAIDIFETSTDENGKETTVSKTVETVNYDDPNGYSPYAKFFDESSSKWERDSDYNYSFLKAQQSYANNKLRADKYLFLNDVYEMLGIPKTKAGQVVGWVYDEENPIGDNYVDFGIYDIRKEAARDFVNGYNPSILLDFNVDGNIWELMT